MAEIAISSLSWDKYSINEGIEEIEPFISFLHLDIMDGKFVSNRTFGVEILDSIRTKLNIDVHLMVEEISRNIERMRHVHSVNFHYEECSGFEDAVEVIEMIKLRGMKPGIVISPGTPASSIRELVPFLHQVLVMSVHPGRGGQKFMPSALRKVRYLRKLSDKVVIAVDGGINLSNCRAIADAGADMLIVGSAIMGQKDKGRAIEEFINKLK